MEAWLFADLGHSQFIHHCIQAWSCVPSPIVCRALGKSQIVPMGWLLLLQPALVSLDPNLTSVLLGPPWEALPELHFSTEDLSCACC